MSHDEKVAEGDGAEASAPPPEATKEAPRAAAEVTSDGTPAPAVENDNPAPAPSAASPAESPPPARSPETPPPVETPDAPPAAEPPKDAPPAAEPPKDAPPAGEPPKDAPPAGEPPKDASPAAEPPQDAPSPEAPAAEPPKDAPSPEAPAAADGVPAAAAAPSADGVPAPTPSAAGGEKKKRKRRRRRKKKGGEEGKSSQPGEPRASSAGRKPGGGKPPERPAFNIGDEIFGRVSKVSEEAIWLDVAGGKAQGIYDRSDLIQVPPKEGQQFIAKVKSISSRGGVMMLGRDLWDTTASRTEVRAALDSQVALMFWVTGVIKGGLEVDYKGVRAFAPASHVDVRPNADLKPLLGEKLPFVVTHYAKKGRDVVVSRKAMVEAEHTEKRKELLSGLTPDVQVKAVVRNVLQWGAFVSLPDHGDVEGVIHMSEASHNRSARLNDIFKPGKEIEVKVLKVDDKGKLWLSHKATQTDPWEKAPETYAAGTIHKGKVVRLTDFGAFVQLEPGIDGLCHVADLSFTHVEHPKEVVEQGQDLEVIVANIDPKARKVTLHPAPPEDERDQKRRGRISSNQVVQVEVQQHREAGLGVRIVGATGRHARGFIHASQTGTPRGTDLRKSFPLGKRFDAKVTEADARRGEARLSIRALKSDAEKKAYRDYRKKVQREATFGTFADLLKDKL